MEGMVSYVPLSLEEGLHVTQLTEAEFDNCYKPIPNYPVERAAILYYQYACTIGATPEALSFIGRYVEVNPMEIEMANARRTGTIVSTPAPERAKNTAKRTERTKASEVDPSMAIKPGRPKKQKVVSKKANAVEVVKATATATKKLANVKETTTPTPTKKTKEKPGGGATGARTSSANLFKALIMQGQLTDEQIFEQVRKEFGLDEKKRGYVSWYRNDLRKKGQNPPAPVKAKKD